VALGQLDGRKASAVLSLPEMPNSEVVVTISLVAPLAPRCWLEPDVKGSGGAVLAVIYPDESSLQQLWPSVEKPIEPTLEFIFLLDRSGSMSGSLIRKAADALQVFLRSLPSNCLFDIVGFGSRWESLFGSSVKYGADTLKTASEHVQGVQANFGGTEILQPLEAIFARELKKRPCAAHRGADRRRSQQHTACPGNYQK